MIIGIAGLIGSGKNSVADYLVQQYGFTQLSFAASVKDCLAAIFGWNREDLEGLTPASRAWREQVDTWWAARLGIENFSPRYAMTKFATDTMRDVFHSDIWIASLERKIQSIKGHVVISDCRFLNEMHSIRRLDGVLVRVVRGEEPSWVQLAKTDVRAMSVLYPNIHSSEYSHVGYDFDYTVSNDGSLDDLHARINDLFRDLRSSR